MYKRMGVDTKELGCIMLDLDPIDISGIIFEAKNDLYISKDPAKFWIKGAVAEKTPHVTLLYGLMEPGKKWKDYVDEILKDWSIDKVVVDHVGYFDNHYEDEDYYCIVAHVKVNDNLQEGNTRLKFLPHIDTFPEYKPHITLAYIKKDEKVRDEWISDLNDELKGKSLKVASGLNYGGKLGE
jgi:2'-5' RNA ligase